MSVSTTLIDLEQACDKFTRELAAQGFSYDCGPICPVKAETNCVLGLPPCQCFLAEGNIAICLSCNGNQHNAGGNEMTVRQMGWALGLIK